MDRNKLKETALNNLELTLSDDVLNKLDSYAEFLMEYNKHTNLTAIKTKEDIYLKHFYDSLTIVKSIDLNTVSSLCDVGSGAGFPGLVLKIVYPNLHVVLIDSNNKKTKFLNEVIKILDLKNIEVINTRSEDYARDNLETFDIVTARAVTTLKALIELCLPLVKINGYFIPLKANVEDEINASKNILNILNGEIEDIEEFKLPEEDATRTIIKIKKKNSTPNGYPRSYDKIKKSLKKRIK